MNINTDQRFPDDPRLSAEYDPTPMSSAPSHDDAPDQTEPDHAPDQTGNYGIRQLALACFLECDPDDLTENRYDNTKFNDSHSRRRRVLADDEADDEAKSYIRESAEQEIGDVPDGFRDYIDLDRYVEDHFNSGDRAAALNPYDGTEEKIDTDTEQFREWVYLTFGIDHIVEPDAIHFSDGDASGGGVFYIY